MRRYGERSGKKVIAARPCGIRRAGEPENKALRTPCAALLLRFQPRGGKAKGALVPLRNDQADIRAEGRFFEQVFLPVQALLPLLFRQDVRVIKENIDGKMRREPLKSRARARRTAAVKQKARSGIERGDHGVHLTLIVSLLHGTRSFPRRGIFIL